MASIMIKIVVVMLAGLVVSKVLATAVLEGWGPLSNVTAPRQQGKARRIEFTPRENKLLHTHLLRLPTWEDLGVQDAR